MEETMSLEQLPIGKFAYLNKPIRLNSTIFRLLELGMTNNTKIEMIAHGPYGDPVQIKVRGTKICLRKQDASFFPITQIL